MSLKKKYCGPSAESWPVAIVMGTVLVAGCVFFLFC